MCVRYEKNKRFLVRVYINFQRSTNEKKLTGGDGGVFNLFSNWKYYIFPQYNRQKNTIFWNMGTYFKLFLFALTHSLVRLQRTAQNKKSIILNNIGEMSYLWYLSLHERQIFLHHGTLLWFCCIFINFLSSLADRAEKHKKELYCEKFINLKKIPIEVFYVLLKCIFQQWNLLNMALFVYTNFSQLFLRLDFILPHWDIETETQKKTHRVRENSWHTR
jgi:hypothetical protein